MVCHTIIIPRITNAATTGANIIKVRNSAPLSVVVARNFTFSSSILVSVSSARRSSISAITQVRVVQVADMLDIYDSGAVVVYVGDLVQAVPLRTEVTNIGRDELQCIGVVPR